MKFLAGAAFVFAAGLGAGWWISGASAKSPAIESHAAAKAEPSQLVELHAKLRGLEDEKGSLAERNAALEKEVESLHAEQTELETSLREMIALADSAQPDDANSQDAAARGARGGAAGPFPGGRGGRRGGEQRPAPTAEVSKRYNLCRPGSHARSRPVFQRGQSRPDPMEIQS